MTIPDDRVGPSLEIPTAQLIEVPPPKMAEPAPVSSVIVGREPTSEVVARPTPRSRPKPVVETAWTPIEPPAPPEPEFEPDPIDLPIELGPIHDGSPEPSRVPLGRIAAVLAAIFGLFVVVALAGAILGSREEKPPAPLAVVATAPEPKPEEPAPVEAPAPTPVEAPVPAAPVPVPPTVAPSPRVEVVQPEPRLEPKPVPEPATARSVVIHRRQRLGQEELRRQLANVPEIMISHQTEGALLSAHGLSAVPHQIQHRRQPVNRIVGQAGFLAPVFSGPAARARPEHQGAVGGHLQIARPKDTSLATLALLKRRQPELGQLPWRMGEECHLGRESAEELEVQSRSLRDHLTAAIPAGDTRPDADALRAALFRPFLGAALG